MRIVETKITLDIERIQYFCRRWLVIEFALFGSVLCDDFGPESDVDVLITFAAEFRPNGLHIVRMERELREMFGRPVDIITRRGVEQSRNERLRQDILSSAEVIYTQAA